MHSLEDQLSNAITLNRVTIPDLWQQESVQALREGKDVVVQAPTGAGKTLIFELWSNQGKNRGQAIYTVPTRALANDKLAEWRAQGWNVGIATGDLADNLGAPVLVATLETQKNRLIQGDGPALLVVDEYQMIGDEDRGLNYELAIALAPAHTRLLLLSGSVANPQQVVQWLHRLGRQAVLIHHQERPVPLEEICAAHLDLHVPADIKGYWPRFTAKSLASGLGPILIFAPRRQGAEKLAAELSRQLPTPNPLQLREDQKQLVGDDLARMLKNRIAYHHSGLSYGARAGVIEPLAKAGQLRVVVATMGLAAGINFSLRSVALAGDSYRRDQIDQPLRPDEILQMFGRAGRRGIDEIGYVLVSANQIRLRDAYPGHLSRSGLVDWGALLGIMAAAADQGKAPFGEAVKVQERLFTSKPIFLGVEQSLGHPNVPCQLQTDPERARFVRKKFKEFLNSQGEWERLQAPLTRPLEVIKSAVDFTPGMAPALRPLLTEPAALEPFGHGTLTEIGRWRDQPLYGRAITVGEVAENDRVQLTKWIRRLTGWRSKVVAATVWEERVVPLIEQKLAKNKTPLLRMNRDHYKIIALVSLEKLSTQVAVDRHDTALWHPPTRDVPPPICEPCPRRKACLDLPTATGVAMLWRRLGLVEPNGIPTRRGRVVSFFSQGVGLAVAAGLEDDSYPLDELVYALANLDAGFRFCQDEDRWAGRLAVACRQCYGMASVPGYLENGVPGKYGSGAEQVVASVHKNPLLKTAWISEFLGVGDIDRIIIEWRSLLRQIVHAPELPWPRWRELKGMARSILNETQSPTLTDLPPLDYNQSRRVDHRLPLRR